MHWRLGLILSVFLSIPLLAQEPAFFEHGQVARFESNPGVYHYVMPCADAATAVGQGPQSPSQMTALCWPVRAVHLRLVNGKMQQVPPQILGNLHISAGTLQLTSGNPKETASNFTAAAREVQFWHKSGESFATIGIQPDAYQFVFLNVCYSCKSTDPEPPPNKASLDEEFSLVQQTLRDFPTAFKRVNDIALKMRIEVTPHNQPKQDQNIPAAIAMGLYSAINSKLADSCSEPAKACVQTYARYQACKASSLTADCGVPPTCTAVCNITRETFVAMKGSFCTSQGDSMTITPNWTPYFADDSKRRIPADPVIFLQHDITFPKTIKMLHEDSPPPPLPPQDTCNASAVFNQAFLANSIPRNLAMMPDPVRLPNRALRVPANITQGRLISQTQPVYPPIAKAAHIAGSVTLHATIAKDGTVATLEATGGPQLLWQSAIDAVKLWTFRPYLLDGEPMAVDTTIIVNYNLNAETEPANPVTFPPPK